MRTYFVANPKFKNKACPNVLAVTEQGVAMLSGILNRDRAIEVNIAIMRVFVRIRELLDNRKKLTVKLQELENRIQDNDEKIIAIFEAIRQLMTPPETPKRKIGFHLKEKQVRYEKRGGKNSRELTGPERLNEQVRRNTNAQWINFSLLMRVFSSR